MLLKNILQLLSVVLSIAFTAAEVKKSGDNISLTCYRLLKPFTKSFIVYPPLQLKNENVGGKTFYLYYYTGSEYKDPLPCPVPPDTKAACEQVLNRMKAVSVENDTAIKFTLTMGTEDGGIVLSCDENGDKELPPGKQKVERTITIVDPSTLAVTILDDVEKNGIKEGKMLNATCKVTTIGTDEPVMGWKIRMTELNMTQVKGEITILKYVVKEADHEQTLNCTLEIDGDLVVKESPPLNVLYAHKSVTITPSETKYQTVMCKAVGGNPPELYWTATASSNGINVLTSISNQTANPATVNVGPFGNDTSVKCTATNIGGSRDGTIKIHILSLNVSPLDLGKVDLDPELQRNVTLTCQGTPSKALFTWYNITKDSVEKKKVNEGMNYTFLMTPNEYGNEFQCTAKVEDQINVTESLRTRILAKYSITLKCNITIEGDKLTVPLKGNPNDKGIPSTMSVSRNGLFVESIKNDTSKKGGREKTFVYTIKVDDLNQTLWLKIRNTNFKYNYTVPAKLPMPPPTTIPDAIIVIIIAIVLVILSASIIIVIWHKGFICHPKSKSGIGSTAASTAGAFDHGVNIAFDSNSIDIGQSTGYEVPQTDYSSLPLPPPVPHTSGPQQPDKANSEDPNELEYGYPSLSIQDPNEPEYSYPGLSINEYAAVVYERMSDHPDMTDYDDTRIMDRDYGNLDSQQKHYGNID